MEFQCDVYPKTFSRNFLLQRHKDTVHGNVNQFECLRCQEQFGRKDKSNEHCSKCVMNCKFCETNFENQKDMSIHKQTHHSDKKFECLKCGKKYSEKRDLKKHQQKCTQTVSILYYFYAVTTIMKRNPNRDVLKCILNFIVFTMHIKLYFILYRCITFQIRVYYVDLIYLFHKFKIILTKILEDIFIYFSDLFFCLYHINVGICGRVNESILR